MDQNVTKGNLKNLITDKPSPITVALAQKAKAAALAQAKAKGSDGAQVFTLMDQNVTKGQMKNLITDKPSPITVALSQKAKAAALAQAKTKGADGASVFTLMDQNVTKGAMKNLITDKPSPLTVALGQKKPVAKQMIQMEKAAAGVPVLVNPVLKVNTEHETDLGLKLLVGPDEVSVAKKNAAKKPASFAEIESSDDDEELVQLTNPVNNPPYNNWSVNQPSVPHNHGLAGKADLGQNIIVDGHHVHYAQVNSSLWVPKWKRFEGFDLLICIRINLFII